MFFSPLIRKVVDLLHLTPKAIICGTGRCGTGYVARILRTAGLRCGHEKAFSAAGWRPTLDLDVEVSWLAWPYTSEAEGPVVQLVRDPVHVINSFLALGFFSNEFSSPHKRFASRFFDFTGDEVSDAIRWYLQLNRHLERVSLFRFKIEEPLTGLRRVVLQTKPACLGKVNEAVVAEDRTVNIKVKEKRRWAQSHSVPEAVNWTTLPPGRDTDALRQMAESYDYEVPS